VEISAVCWGGWLFGAGWEVSGGGIVFGWGIWERARPFLRSGGDGVLGRWLDDCHGFGH
jgi:hypothetical protein